MGLAHMGRAHMHRHTRDRLVDWHPTTRETEIIRERERERERLTHGLTSNAWSLQSRGPKLQRRGGRRRLQQHHPAHGGSTKSKRINNKSEGKRSVGAECDWLEGDPSKTQATFHNAVCHCYLHVHVSLISACVCLLVALAGCPCTCCLTVLSCCLVV